jgi:6-phosphogluconolactonase
MSGLSFLRSLWLLTLASGSIGGYALRSGSAQVTAHVSRGTPGHRVAVTRKVVLYASNGPELMQYDVNVDSGTLTKRGSVSLPGSVTDVAYLPSKRCLYVVWGYDNDPVVNGKHQRGITALRVDMTTGALQQVPHPIALAGGSGYISSIITDLSGEHVLMSDTEPSEVLVYRIQPDGTLGAKVDSESALDFGFHMHQVRIDPSNKIVIGMARGNGPTKIRPEDPGALKVFSYQDGLLKNLASVAPEDGFNFQPRNLDFDPKLRWDYVTLERQNKLLVFKRLSDGTTSNKPLFAVSTLDSITSGGRNTASTVHVHPNGRFVYVGNRASDTKQFQGKAVFEGGENSIAVYEIDQNSGEPKRIQTADTRGLHPRTFSIDPSGRLLVVGNIMQLPVRDGNTVHNVPASLAVFHIGEDGRLTFVHKYDVDVGNNQLLWVGMISLH